MKKLTFLFCLLPILASASLVDGLVSYYQLNAQTGADATDQKGTNTLYSYSNAYMTNGFIRNGYGGNTNNISARYSPSGDFKLGGANMGFTVAGWVWLDSTDGWSTVISQWHQDDANACWEFAHRPGKFEVLVSTNGNTAAGNTVDATYNAVAPVSNRWYFWSVWYVQSNSINLQIDNGITNSGALSQLNTNFNYQVHLTLGAMTNSSTRYMHGRIDEVGYWNRVLTAAERTQLYNNGRGLSYPFRKKYPLVAGRDGHE